MGKGTRILIAVIAGALTTVLLLIAVYLTATILAFMELNALVSAQMSAIAANPNTYASLTPTANGTITHSFGVYDADRTFRMLTYLGITSGGGVAFGILTYYLSGRVRVPE